MKTVVFVDINTFYCPKAGGIRTYHTAKIDWFIRNPGHTYFLIFPGSGFRVTRPAKNVNLVEVYGPRLGADPQGYRLLLDFFRVFRLLRQLKPDVVEAGDPWLTGLFCLALRHSRYYKGLLSSFYHGDPLETYLLPWSRRGKGIRLKWLLVKWAEALFYRMQRAYDLTLASSQTMVAHLGSKGVERMAHAPFGVDASFMERNGDSSPIPPKLPELGESAPGKSISLLYAGRLDKEKGIELLIDILPRLMQVPGVTLTIIGRGRFTEYFANHPDPRIRYQGYIRERAEMAEVYHSHQILLAPGPFETFGLGVLEGLAMGLVVVGPNRGGTGELLKELESEFIFTADDPESFLQKTLSALNCDFPVASLRSRVLAQKYGTWNDAIGRMIDRYEQEVKRFR